jgi:thymidylate synthase (FAD)
MTWTTDEMTLTRPSVPALDALLGQPYPVLNDGFVRVVDYMGDDAAIVQAARTSYAKGTKAVSEDRALLRYLMRHEHWTPFEMCELKLHVRVPLFVWQQWLRHRMASINQESLRYSEATDAFFQVPDNEWRQQSTTNKQGSAGAFDIAVGSDLGQQQRVVQDVAWSEYEARLDRGVARELARVDLPVSLYTEAYWKVDLRNLFNFLRLRLDPHAQQEIRQYAEVIAGQFVALWVPHAWEAFVDYQKDSLTLSRLERWVMRALAQGQAAEATQLAKAFGWLECREDGTVRAHRERGECELKLRRLGFAVPWQEPDA